MRRPVSHPLLITVFCGKVFCFLLTRCKRQGLRAGPDLYLCPGQWAVFALVCQPGKVLPCALRWHWAELPSPASESGGCPADHPKGSSKGILAKGSRVRCRICDLLPTLPCGETERRALQGCPLTVLRTQCSVSQGTPLPPPACRGGVCPGGPGCLSGLRVGVRMGAGGQQERAHRAARPAAASPPPCVPPDS